MRTRVEAAGLFRRPWWPDGLRDAGVKTRLLNRLAWTAEGLTAAEREALDRIAEGHRVDDVDLDTSTARAALEYPWLRSRP